VAESHTHRLIAVRPAPRGEMGGASPFSRTDLRYTQEGRRGDAPSDTARWRDRRFSWASSAVRARRSGEQRRDRPGPRTGQKGVPPCQNEGCERERRSLEARHVGAHSIDVVDSRSHVCSPPRGLAIAHRIRTGFRPTSPGLASPGAGGPFRELTRFVPAAEPQSRFRIRDSGSAMKWQTSGVEVSMLGRTPRELLFGMRGE